MTARALPPRLRRRLAEAIMTALRDAGARGALAALGASRQAARTWCGDDDRAYGDLVQARAGRAARALATMPVGAERELDGDLEASATLFDAALFFESHEVLEPHWRRARGEAREALQGLIQIAVGYEHWAHGNVRGARSLLAAGTARVRGRWLRGTQLDGFAASVSRSSARIEGCEPSAPPFPRPRVSRADSP